MKENFESRRKELFRKYLNDTCTEEELTELFSHLQHADNLQEYQEVLEDIWKKLSYYKTMNRSSADNIFDKVVSTPPTAPKPSPPREAGGSVLFPFFSIGKVAAIITVLLLASLALYQFLGSDSITLHTDYGETRVFWLPDSSQVTLNGNSSLTYNAHWGQENIFSIGHTTDREVWLAGEAYFEVREVTKQAGTVENSRPEKVKFIVHTAHLNVEVLGTAFNVHNLSDKTQVVLSAGQVKLKLPEETKSPEMLMQPGDLVEYNAEENRVEQKVVNPSLYSSWKHHQLIFNETPLEEIAQILEYRYGFTVALDEKNIGFRKFTGTIDTMQIELLLKALASSFNLNITKNGKQIIMKYQ